MYHTHRPPRTIISTKFEVDMTIHFWVIAFLLLISYVTLNSCHSCQVMWPTLLPSWKVLCLFVLELRLITSSIGYHWKFIYEHCTCAESSDRWIWGQKQSHFWNPRPQFAYSLHNFYGATTTIKGRLLMSASNAKALDGVNFLYVTLWPWPLIFWPWTVVTCSTLPPS